MGPPPAVMADPALLAPVAWWVPRNVIEYLQCRLNLKQSSAHSDYPKVVLPQGVPLPRRPNQNRLLNDYPSSVISSASLVGTWITTGPMSAEMIPAP